MPVRLPPRLTSLVLLAGLALCLLGLAPARAEFTFPPFTGRVVDAANILDPATRATLEEKLAAQETATTDQFVVATVPSLQDTAVEDYANRLFRDWKIGQTTKNNGVLLMVAPNERKVRIEVGYGLEGVLPDAVASTIIQTVILPAFRSGDFPAGIVAGADAIIEILNLDPEEAKMRARQAEEPAMTTDDWIFLLFFLAMVIFWIYVIYRSARGGVRSIRRGGGAILPGGVSTWNWSRGSGSGGGFSGGGFSGGGGSSGGGGASGSW